MSADDKAAAFFGSDQDSLTAFRDLSSCIDDMCPDAVVSVQGSLLVFRTRAGFAYVSRPAEGEKGRLFTLALVSRRRPDGKRVENVVQTIPGQKSYVYHIGISSPGDIDRELKLLIRQSYEYSKLGSYA